MCAGLAAMRLTVAYGLFDLFLVAMFATFAAPGAVLGYARRRWRGCIIDGAVTGLLGVIVVIVVLSVLPGPDPATVPPPPMAPPTTQR